MKTEYIRIARDSFALSELEGAAEIIRTGGLVAFPTETVYGLGADAENPSAAEKIYAAKGRPSSNPLIVHIAKPEDAERYVYTDARYYKIAEAFMPGPITVIMPTKHTVAESVSAGLDTLAVRCPSHPVARALIELSGKPIAAPSANTSGRPSPTSAEHVKADLDTRIDMIIDGGECEVGLESTILKLTSEKVILLRPGKITYEMLCELLGEVEIAKGVIDMPDPASTVESPGMLISHYAPKAPLYLVKGSRAGVEVFLRGKLAEDAVFVLSEDGVFEGERVLSLGDPDDREDAASRLFGVLREADARGAVEIYAKYPDKSGIGLALLNRMLRASAFKIIEI